MVVNRYNTLTQKDEEILRERQAQRLNSEKLRVGDFVRYPDGEVHRIAHVWGEREYQPEDARFGASYYLGDGYVEFSGGLQLMRRPSALRKSGTTMRGAAWFFHNNDVEPHNGVHVTLDFPVWAAE